jgi:hypothetical protein
MSRRDPQEAETHSLQVQRERVLELLGGLPPCAKGTGMMRPVEPSSELGGEGGEASREQQYSLDGRGQREQSGDEDTYELARD